MEVMVIGAGQEVGRSCVVVTIADKTIMFDCGMHLGYNDARKFPDFQCLSKTGHFTHIVDCVIISHFHLDHCGALPYFTEKLGYSGPIIMTHPTKAVLPVLLEDCSRIISGKGKDAGNANYTLEDIARCMEKVVGMHIRETYEPVPGLRITPHYAGHVIGAAMFHVSYRGTSVVYTGDYNTSADRHLGPASIPVLRPDLLITESTYGGVVRECRRVKERQFLQLIHSCIKRNGTVLIPVFALGRAQEICLLIENYWERMGWSIPVYFAGGITEKANKIYKRFVAYTNEFTRKQMVKRNVFDFKSIRPYERNAENNGPCVVLSSPAMLHSGQSLRIFKNICDDEKNLVILPGYCLRGTVGDKILCGAKELTVLGDTKKIRLQVENLAFSAHSDTLGISWLAKQCEPRNILLVHGEKMRMKALKKEISKEMSIPVYMPTNGTVLTILGSAPVPLYIPEEELKKHIDFAKAEQPFDFVLKIKKNENRAEVHEMKPFFREEKEEEMD